MEGARKPKAKEPKPFSTIREIRQKIRTYPATIHWGYQREFAHHVGISLISLQLIEAGTMRLSVNFAKKIGEKLFLNPTWLLLGKEGTTPIADDGGPWSVEYYVRKLDNPENEVTSHNHIRGISVRDFGARYGRLLEGVLNVLLKRNRISAADRVGEAMVRAMEEATRSAGLVMDVWESMRQSDEIRSESTTLRLEPTDGGELKLFQALVGRSLETLMKDDSHT